MRIPHSEYLPAPQNQPASSSAIAAAGPAGVTQPGAASSSAEASSSGDSPDEVHLSGDSQTIQSSFSARAQSLSAIAQSVRGGNYHVPRRPDQPRSCLGNTGQNPMTPAAPDRTAAVLSELEAVRMLLLTPDSASMLSCESRLRGITAETSALRGTPSSDVKRALTGIRFLLDSARGFWLSRQPSAHQPLQYVPGGSLLLSGEECTFSVEL